MNEMQATVMGLTDSECRAALLIVADNSPAAAAIVSEVAEVIDHARTMEEI
jgi:hypothetical protein